MRLKLLLVGFLLSFQFDSMAATDLRAVGSISKQATIAKPDFLITNDHGFYGLASVYNEVQPIYLEDGKVVYVDSKAEIEVPVQAEYIGWKSRYQIGMVKNTEGANFLFNQNDLFITASQPLNLETYIGPPVDEFKTIKYSHLWNWMKWITVALEWLLVTVFQLIGNWGWSIVVFSLVIRILLFPVGQITAVSQKRVSRYQAELEPILNDIKQNYKGEKAHNKLMAAHKSLGITPFFSLKPMLLNLIQFPILIAIFNMLGELEPLQGISFLWINDLSLTDAIFNLPMTVPFMGETFNLLPFAMTVITIVSTVTFQNNIAPEAEVKRQKRNLYFMAIGFFILCYPFPSSMVLYWLLANFWQFLTQLIINKKQPN